MVAKYATVKGSSSLTTTPFYIGLVQHDRVLKLGEAYSYAANATGRTSSEVWAVFEALNRVIRKVQDNGNASVIDNIATFRTYVNGSFNSSIGPWVLGKNLLLVNALEANAFKNTLSGIIPVNATESAKPIINSVLDEVTGVYDIITGDDIFQISGTELAPDTTKTDEYVCLVDASGVEHKATITLSDLGLVKAYFDPALAAGNYTLKVYTRCGYGEGRGVVSASRRVTVVAAA